MHTQAPNPTARPSRRPLIIAISLTLTALIAIGLGLYTLVDWLKPPPIEAPPEELRAQPGLQRFQPLTRRHLLSRVDPRDDDEEPPAVPPDHPFAKTRITGRVYDIDTGEGIAAAIVRVRPTFGEPKLGAPSGDGSAAFTTHSDGSYALKGVPPGTFDLEIQAAGYATAKSSFKKFSAIEDDDGFDVGLIRGGALEGRVLTSDRRPVSGARVAISTSEAISLHDQATLATTGDDGHFVLDPVEARDLRVYATHPTLGSELLYVPASEQQDRQIEIVLSRGRVLRGHVRDSSGPIADAQVMIGLQRVAERIIASAPTTPGVAVKTARDGSFELAVADSGPVVILTRAAGYELGTTLVSESGEAPNGEIDILLERATDFAGIVLTADGRPALKAQVTITPFANRNRRLPLEAWTGPDGRFAVEGVPRTGPYRVSVLHHEHPPLVLVEERVGPEHRYQLEAQGRILGTIIDAANGGPVTRYQYAVSGPTRRHASAVSISGAFEVDQLPAGTYALSIDAEGYESKTVESILVSAGETVENLTVRLTPAGAIVGRIRGSFSGTVIVHAWDRESRLEAEAVVSDDGRFSLNDLPSGTYTLTAVGEGDEGEVRGELENVGVQSGSVTRDIEISVTPNSEIGP